ncbi:MAG: hypothetical protein Ct9H300mP14_04770 [Gammaproteobacteria bacterium]|nr:MAG: hypothetical protein Ct9H300mP14_04770 [Gammaproteobacteria bacterium]
MIRRTVDFPAHSVRAPDLGARKKRQRDIFENIIFRWDYFSHTYHAVNVLGHSVIKSVSEGGNLRFYNERILCQLKKLCFMWCFLTRIVVCCVYRAVINLQPRIFS